MKTFILDNPPSGYTQSLKLAAASLFLAIAVGTPAALADPPHNNRGQQQERNKHWQRGERDWHEHEGHANRYWRSPRYARQPEVIYAPPLVYAPQPVYQQPGLNFIIPLYIN